MVYSFTTIKHSLQLFENTQFLYLKFLIIVITTKQIFKAEDVTSLLACFVSFLPKILDFSI